MELICTHCRYQGWLGVILVPKSTNGIKEVLVKNESCQPFHVKKHPRRLFLRNFKIWILGATFLRHRRSHMVPSSTVVTAPRVWFAQLPRNCASAQFAQISTIMQSYPPVPAQGSGNYSGCALIEGRFVTCVNSNLQTKFNWYLRRGCLHQRFLLVQHGRPSHLHWKTTVVRFNFEPSPVKSCCFCRRE